MRAAGVPPSRFSGTVVPSNVPSPLPNSPLPYSPLVNSGMPLVRLLTRLSAVSLSALRLPRKLSVVWLEPAASAAWLPSSASPSRSVGIATSVPGTVCPGRLHTSAAPPTSRLKRSMSFSIFACCHWATSAAHCASATSELDPAATRPPTTAPVTGSTPPTPESRPPRTPSAIAPTTAASSLPNKFPTPSAPPLAAAFTPGSSVARVYVISIFLTWSEVDHDAPVGASTCATGSGHRWLRSLRVSSEVCIVASSVARRRTPWSRTHASAISALPSMRTAVPRPARGRACDGSMPFGPRSITSVYFPQSATGYSATCW